MIRSRMLTALILVAALAASPLLAQDTGRADFNRFVALGDSLAAGFTSGGLVRGAQENSVPALLARQAAGTEIEQPLVSEPGIPGLLALRSLAPVTIAPVPGMGEPLNLGLARPYDNLSVPGFDVGEALRNRDRPGDDLASLILRAPNTMIEQALALQPTFALVWLGNNDVLGAVTSGRVVEGVTITPPTQFESDYTGLVGLLKSNGADLVLATLPDVAAIPYATTIPPVVIDPATGEPATGPNGQPIPLIGPNGPLGPNELVLLPASALLEQGVGIPAAVGGTGQPLPNSTVLSAGEISTIRDRIARFNRIIREVANQTDSAVADIASLQQRASGNGFDLGGVTLTSSFVTGGLISLDGIHPTPLGYALIANEFIRVINDHYGARIEEVDLYPFLFGDAASPLPPVAGASMASLVFAEEAGQQLIHVLNADRPSDGGGGERDGDAVGRGIRETLRPVVGPRP